MKVNGYYKYSKEGCAIPQQKYINKLENWLLEYRKDDFDFNVIYRLYQAFVEASFEVQIYFHILAPIFSFFSLWQNRDFI